MKNQKTSPSRFITVISGLLILLSVTNCGHEPTEKPAFFTKAEPVWPVGRTLEKNLTVGFRTEFNRPESGSAVLKITGATLYHIYLNGTFIGFGPARAGHGFYRVDEWDLSKKLIAGMNTVAIEVAGYNVNSYYLLDQPSFIQAEVVSGGRVLAATSQHTSDFEVIKLDGRVQKVPRYSFQRPFTEVYRLEPGFDVWRTGQKAQGSGLKGSEKFESGKLKVESAGVKNLIPRRIGYPDFTLRQPVRTYGLGHMKTGIVREKYWKDRSVVNIGKALGGFIEKELTLNQSIALQEMETAAMVADSSAYVAGSMFHLKAEQFRIFDFGTNLTGFVGTNIEMLKPGRLYLIFDEILTDGDVDFKRLGCINAVTYDLSAGKYSLESFEPYTMRYLKIILIDGEGTVSNISLREYANSDISRASFESSDPRLNRIYKAGVETFRQNAVDIFMDCPHRERAGWLCDSYFTARVASDVSGNTLIEKNFLENFALPDSFAYIPKGMLPMCYPADHNDGVFIPNWAMWFVIELKEYQKRSNDRQLVDALKPRVMDLLKYFQPFKNSDGLLEKLKSWIFVEWSEANNFVQDVNYPTNMLYAATLDAAGDLYGLDSLKKEAAAMRETIRKQSYNGTFFVDNAVRGQEGRKAEGQKEGFKAQGTSYKGALVLTSNTTEVCQYFAFYFGVATPERYPELWKKLSEQFGPKRRTSNPYPNVPFANSFVGNYLRLELLAQNNLRSQLLDESIDFFDYMALRTGTLWENTSAYASCDHGFASHVVHVLYRDVLGIAAIDILHKEVTLQFSDLNLTDCEGEVPVGNALVSLRWKRTGDLIEYHFECPEGYHVVIRNNSKLKLAEE